MPEQATQTPTAPARRRRVPGLVWVLAAALALRAGLALAAWLLQHDPAVFATPDTRTYVVPAAELLRYGTFTTHRAPEVLRTPGYPLLLLPGLLAGNVTGVTIALQVALSLLTVAGVHRLALELTADRRVALAAAAVYALEPLSVTYASLLLTETLFTAALVWGLVAVVRYRRTGRLRTLLLAAAGLALAAYVRPVAYPLAFVVPGGLALLYAAGREWRRVGHAAAAAALGAALLVPWQLRNRAEAEYGGFSGIGAAGLHFYSAGAVLARQNGISLAEQQARMGWTSPAVYFRLHPEQRTWPMGRQIEYHHREGVRIVRENLPVYAREHLRGTVAVVVASGADELRRLLAVRAPEDPRPLHTLLTGAVFRRLAAGGADAAGALLDALATLFLLAAYLAAAVGLVRVRRLGGVDALGLACVAAFLVLVPGPAGGARFRHPVMPLVAVVAGAGLAGAAERGRSRRLPREEADAGSVIAT